MLADPVNESPFQVTPVSWTFMVWPSQLQGGVKRAASDNLGQAL
jgi:hypothetical protein